MKLLGAFAILTATLSTLVSAVVLPGASTPLFYLVATAPESTGVNFLPIRVSGGSNPYSILNTDQPPAQFYFSQGQLLARDQNGQYRVWINTQQTSPSCSTYGTLGVFGGTNTNKCASTATFGLSSNPENSQLGAKLVFNWVGGFYVCGPTKDVYYKVDAADGPGDCSPIDLYTLPVVQ